MATTSVAPAAEPGVPVTPEPALAVEEILVRTLDEALRHVDETLGAGVRRARVRLALSRAGQLRAELEAAAGLPKPLLDHHLAAARAEVGKIVRALNPDATAEDVAAAAEATVAPYAKPEGPPKRGKSAG